MKKLLLPCLLALLVLTGCDYSGMIEDLEHEAESGATDHYLQLLQEGDYDQFISESGEEIRREATPVSFNALRLMWPDQAVAQRDLIGAHVFRTIGEGDRYSFDFQYKFGDSTWWVLSIIYQYSPDRSSRTLLGFRINQIPAPLEEINHFRLSDKPVAFTAIVVVACLVTLFIIATFIACIRTPIKKRKWLWLLFISVGVVGFRINMTDGSFWIRPFSIQLLGSGYERASIYAPVIVITSIPLGAILFWIRRRHLIRESEVVDQGAACPFTDNIEHG